MYNSRSFHPKRTSEGVITNKNIYFDKRKCIFLKSTLRLTEPSCGTSAEVGPKHLHLDLVNPPKLALKGIKYDMFKSLWSGLGVIKPEISENLDILNAYSVGFRRKPKF